MRAVALLAVAVLLAGIAGPAVGAPVNRVPTGHAGDDQSVNESPAGANRDTATIVILDGSRSYDPDDPGSTQLRVKWKALSRTIGAPPIDASLKSTDELHAEFLAPNLGADDPDTVQYVIQAFAKDVTPALAPGSPTTCFDAGTPYPAQMCDTMTVTVRNLNEGPGLIRSPVKVTPNSVDIIEDKGKTILFEIGNFVTKTGGLQDDKAVLSVQLILRHPDAQSRIDVPMTKIGVSGSFPEVSYWRASLPVDTPALISDSGTSNVDWKIDLEVYDHQGGVRSSRVEGEEDSGETLPVTVDGAAITSLITFSALAPAKPRPTTCFGEGAVLPAQALGVGQVLRPEIFFIDGAAATPAEDRLAGTNALLLLWKVTYQSCIVSGSYAAKGPEVELRSPFHLSLDTLFSGDQEVMVRFYDRLANVKQFVVPITKDVGRPVFFVDAPNTTFAGVPFPFMVYVQDRLDTAVRLQIDNFYGFGAYEDRITSTDTRYSRSAQMFFLPRLSETVAYELGDDSVCEILFDGDGNGLFDSAYDAINLRTTALLPDRRGGAGTVTDYVVDANRDGRGTSGERVIPGNATTKIELADRQPCVLPFTLAEQAFLDKAVTQVYQFNLTRFALGVAKYKIQVNDLVYNQVAQNYVFFYPGGNVTQKLTGSFITKKAETDASVVAVRAANGPFLPGDPIELNVTLRHDSVRSPNLRLPLTLTISEPTAPRFGQSTFVTPLVKSGNDTFVPVPVKPLDPGLHHLRFNVSAPVQVNETRPGNNINDDITVEVFLGMVTDGPYNSGKRWYIRADNRGLPVLDQGAVEVGADGKILAGKLYDLSYKEDKSGPYYQFTAPNKEGLPVNLHWDPLKRYSVTFNKPCEKLSAEERVVNATAEPPQDPKCRAITVLEKSGAGTTTSNDTPSVGLVVLAGIVALAVALRRRFVR